MIPSSVLKGKPRFHCVYTVFCVSSVPGCRMLLRAVVDGLWFKSGSKGEKPTKPFVWTLGSGQRRTVWDLGAADGCQAVQIKANSRSHA